MKAEPIRDKEKIREIRNSLSGRNKFLFELGLFTGLRISDLLKLKVKDVKNKERIHIREEKTGKDKKAPINETCRKIIDAYIENKNDEEYLFQSRKGENKPISRVQAYRILKRAGEEVGLEINIGTHTLRKSFGYHHYQKYKDVALLQTIFNHNSPGQTLDYIGINDDLVKKSIDEFNPFENENLQEK